MNRVTSIAEHLERQSIRAVESTIPAAPQPCGHLHDTTTRYDHDEKVLTFLLVCPACGTEKVLESQPYEPRFVPHAGVETPEAGAKVHQLPSRRPAPPLRRAA